MGTGGTRRKLSGPGFDGFGRFPITRSFPILASPYVPEDFPVVANSLSRA